MMMRLVVTVGLVLTVVTCRPSAVAAAERTSEAFAETGVIVDVHTFFRAAARDDSMESQVALESVAGRALVTETGVYAFLETPENENALSVAGPGSVVSVSGKLLNGSSLLHIDELALVTRVPLIEFGRYRNDTGTEVSLSGVNKCQCGLDVADLPHSCKLGHLHHLEATDGTIYNYLQFDAGKGTFLGVDSHFKAVEVKAMELPGHFLLVHSVTAQ